MAKKKTTKKTKTQLSCSVCDGTGQVCDICGESENACTCLDEGAEDQSFSDCESCEGKGKWEE